MIRIEIEASDDDLVRIEAVRRLCGLKDASEVVGQALVLMGFAAEEAFAGRSFGSVGDDPATYRRVETAALASAARSGRTSGDAPV